jgi:hypothetical protein
MRGKCPKCNCKFSSYPIYACWINGELVIDSGKITNSFLHHYEITEEE